VVESLGFGHVSTFGASTDGSRFHHIFVVEDGRQVDPAISGLRRCSAT
jgi:hypothetical protein